MDSLTPTDRSRVMSAIKGRDTKPEMLVRRLVHRMGYRFRLHRRDLPGRPDIVLPRLKKVVLVNGCFWHRHPDPTCPLSRMPKSNLDFWQPKLEANRERDLRNEEALKSLGWRVMVVWECELRDKEKLEMKLREFLADGHEGH